MLKSTHHPWPPTFRIAATLLSVAIVGGILYFARDVIIPIALAALVTFLLTPVVNRLERWGLPRIPAVAMVILAAILFCVGSGWLVYQQISSLAADLPRYRENIRQKVDSVQSLMHGGAIRSIEETVAGVREELNESATEGQTAAKKDEPVAVRLESGSSFFGFDRLASVGQVMGTAGIVLVLSMFMLIKREDVMHRVVSLGGNNALAATTKALQEAGRRISRYLLMQFLINLNFGVCVGIGLWLIGVPYALLWGACAAIFRYVPFIGPFVAAILPITVSLITFPSWMPLIAVLVLFAVLELINNNVLEPYLYGRSVGISEVAIILAAVCWAWLWGPIGLILATPITVCLVVLGKYVPALSIFDRLLGDRPSLKPHVWLYQRLLTGDEEAADDVVEEFAAKSEPQKTCDELLLPAILLTHRECAAARISPDDEELITASMRELIDEHVANAKRETSTSDAAADELPLVLGIAWEDGERAALEMLTRLLADRCTLQVLTPDLLISQWIDEIRDRKPACLVISSVPPGELTRTRLVAKRVTTQIPELRVVVARWGSKSISQRRRDAFREAGAASLVSNLAEARDAIIPMIQFHVVSGKATNNDEAARQRA